MTDRTHFHANLIFAVGTQVVALRDVVGPQGRTLHPRGSVGVVVAAPRDLQHAYQTYNGYVMSQFKKMQADIRNQGQVKWKHVMHLIRLLISGIHVLRDGVVPVEVGDQREQLLAIKRGEVSWEETERWRLSLHAEFEQTLTRTGLPERPDYERANAFLIKARRAAMSEELP